MELPRRNGEDVYLPDGAFTGAVKRLGGLGEAHDLRIGTSYAFDLRTRMLPYWCADKRKAPCYVGRGVLQRNRLGRSPFSGHCLPRASLPAFTLKWVDAPAGRTLAARSAVKKCPKRSLRVLGETPWHTHLGPPSHSAPPSISQFQAQKGGSLRRVAKEECGR